MHGVKQARLAEPSGLTPARVSQIATRTMIPETAVDELRRIWAWTLEHPDAHLEHARQAADAVATRDGDALTGAPARTPLPVRSSIRA